MSTLETIKRKSQENLNHLVDLGKEQPPEVKTWGVTAGAAVAGGIAMIAGAQSLLAIFAILAAPPISLTVGAIGGGVLGWRYMERQKAASKVTSVDDIGASAPAPADLDASKHIILPQSGEAFLSTPEPTAENQSVEPVAPEPIQIVIPTPPTQQDHLEEIVGIGPVFATRLQAAGIYSFAQLAALNPEQLVEIIALSPGGHTIDAANWIEQARHLADAAPKE